MKYGCIVYREGKQVTTQGKAMMCSFPLFYPARRSGAHTADCTRNIHSSINISKQSGLPLNMDVSFLPNMPCGKGPRPLFHITLTEPSMQIELRGYCTRRSLADEVYLAVCPLRSYLFTWRSLPDLPGEAHLTKCTEQIPL